MRIVARLRKTDNAKYISHLDSLRVLQRSILRAEIPVAYSQGFSPHPLISFATALALGYTSDCEWVDIKMKEEISPDEFIAKLNANLPAGFEAVSAYAVEDSFPAISSFMRSAEYEAIPDIHIDFAEFQNAVDTLLSGSIIVTKRKKSGNKKIEVEADIRPDVYEMKAIQAVPVKLHIVGRLENTGALNVDALLLQLNNVLNIDCAWHVNRKAVNLVDFNE